MAGRAKGGRPELRVVLRFPPAGAGGDLERLKARLVACALRTVRAGRDGS